MVVVKVISLSARANYFVDDKSFPEGHYHKQSAAGMCDNYLLLLFLLLAELFLPFPQLPLSISE